ncbi:MAG: hypothetical protein IT256_09220, partial [Chitinophagaceae bacterium]|nr:hypothetical protein [Chitinophagaceae bacterium]
VPIGTYNYALSKGNKHKPLIYTASPSDNYSLIAQALGIGIADLMALNKDQAMAQLANNKVMLGYIQYNFVAPVAATKPDTQIAAAAAVATIAADTASELLSVGAPSEFENAYKYQTNNETTVDSLEGMVVFFKPQTAVNDQMLYAFSNDLAKGRILKVYNPSNKRYVLTKVIGKLPNTKQYLNAKIGLDGRAREMLETREIKLWCSFYFKY